MRLRTERKPLPWSAVMLLSLVLAGCGGSDTGSSATTSGQGEQQQDVSQGQQPAPGHQDPTPVDKGHEEPESPSSQTPESEVAVENPILADPLPVPIPDDAGADPDVAEPEPQPDPVADRPTLRWDGPLTREDGSKLYPGEISGYRVYYRLRHQDQFQSMLIKGPDSDNLVLDAFDSGAYEFAISTLDTNGLESRRTEPVSVDLI